MQNAMLALFLVSLLATPAFAGYKVPRRSVAERY